MPFSPALMIVGANAIRTAASRMKLHVGDPGTGGTANPTTAGAQAIVWGAATSDGDFDLSGTITFTGGAANGPVQYLSLWNDDLTTWYGNFVLTGDATFNSAGQYGVVSVFNNGGAT